MIENWSFPMNFLTNISNKVSDQYFHRKFLINFLPFLFPIMKFRLIMFHRKTIRTSLLRLNFDQYCGWNSYVFL